MKSFLLNLAEETLRKHPSLDGMTFVFPNRRAVLYFRKHLSSLLSRPTFAPRITTIEEFVSKLSPLHIPDRLELIHRLYKAYYDVMNTRQDGEASMQEPFDQFYFWGDMLLRDFDEVDKYQVGARQLFRDLSNQKELDSSFDFLTQEQLEFLRSFWGNFNKDLNANKRKFLRVWRLLPDVYDAYRTQLREQSLAYEGMLYRDVSDNLDAVPANGPVIFAGFNALTGTEEKIISHFVTQSKGEVHWDLDSYYVNNNAQEAGRFFRQYQRHEVLGKTFPQDIPTNFHSKKIVKVMGSAQHVGQAKLMSQILEEQLKAGIDPEDTLIVLPDEKLLLPVLHGVSGSVEKLNVTMGFPLASTPIFNLIEFLVELQQAQRNNHFNHRQVLALLSHPYLVSADPSHANQTRKTILEKNQVSIPQEFFLGGPPLYALIFQPLGESDLLGYLRVIINEIGTLEYLTALDKEYAFHSLTLINRLEEVMGSSAFSHGPADRSTKESLKSFSRLFRQLGRSQKIPFTGEPLTGLQVMGVLETRNLDYKNVFILSLNEGSMPSTGSKASYIPYNIRKAYALPTAEHQDAMYAYLFYRVLQRAENVFLFYNTEPDILGQGEMSRFLQQIFFESGWEIDKKVLHSPIQPRSITPISIDKTDRVLQDLTKLNEGNRNFKGISPSALNTYIDCQLQFYLKHVAKIREAREVEEYLDARLFGNLLHDVMEKFYRRIQEKKKTNIIQSTDFDHYKDVVSQLIDEAFNKQYGIEPGKKLTYEGQRLVVREIIRSFAERIVEHDKAYTPFTIEGLERGELLYYVSIRNAPGQAVLSGKIDRLDRKGDMIRVLDYKTGRGDLDFDSVESLFTGEGKRNRAVFQTLIYVLLYRANHDAKGLRLVPGLISRLNLFEEELDHRLTLKKVRIDDAGPLLEEFEQRLKALLEEMFDPATPFRQTENVEACKFCLFQNICYR